MSYDPTPEASPDYADDQPTEEQLYEYEHAARRRDADAVLIAMYVAAGEQPPEKVVEQFRKSNLAFHEAREAAGQ